MKTWKMLGLAVAGASLIAFAAAQAADEKVEKTTVKGEVLDMYCYLQKGAKGDQHAECAKMCLQGGMPVGLLADDAKVYLVAGDHKPLNKELADYAGKTVTLRGKVASRNGVNLINYAEIVK